jgi:copper chaperone CopZ
MKYLKISISALALILMSFSVNAQSCKASCCSKKDAKSENSSSSIEGQANNAVLVSNTTDKGKATFKVYGNCGMCETRIEEAIKDIEGIKSASWNAETQMMTIKYKKSIDLDEVQKKIAAVGHDTEKYRAEDSVYNELHGCCKYDRPKV